MDDAYTEAMEQITRLGREIEQLRRELRQLRSDAEYYTDRAVREVSGQIEAHERSHS